MVDGRVRCGLMLVQKIDDCVQERIGLSEEI